MSSNLHSITLTSVCSKEYERGRKSTTELRKIEFEYSIMERRLNDKAKWKSRAERNNLMKEIYNAPEQNGNKLSPSIEEWLGKSKLKSARKADLIKRMQSHEVNKDEHQKHQKNELN